MRAAIVVLGIATAACYAPHYDGVACGPEAACPTGTSCGTDGLCAAVPASGPGVPDASEAPDAAETSPDAIEAPDREPPVTTFAEAPSAFTSSRGAHLVFAADEPATFYCRLDGAPYVPCSSPYDLADLADGEHTFDVYGVDAEENVEPDGARAQWTIDVLAPTATIASGPPALSGTEATFNLTCDEPGCSFECSLDSVAAGVFAACAPPVALTGITEGTRVFKARAVDRAGNPGAATPSYVWDVDADAFSTSIDTGPGAVSGPSVSFTFSTPRTGSTFECSLDPPGAPSYSACLSGATLPALGSGVHHFYVRAVYQGVPANAASQTWTVDATAPTTTISAPTAGATTGKTADFSFSANESGSVFTCQLDAEAVVADCRSPYRRTLLANGAHTMKIHAVDAYGNVGATVTRSWTVDAVAPTVTWGTNPSCTEELSYTVAYSSNDPTATATCYLRVVPGSFGSGVACSLTGHTFTGLSYLETYEIRVRLTDPYGNFSTDEVRFKTLCDLE